MNDREYKIFVLRCLAVIISVCSVGIHCRQKVVNEGTPNAAVVGEVAIGEKPAEDLVEQFKEGVTVSDVATLNEMAAVAEKERLEKEKAPPPAVPPVLPVEEAGVRK